jgi:hypothetical protein
MWGQHNHGGFAPRDPLLLNTIKYILMLKTNRTAWGYQE